MVLTLSELAAIMAMPLLFLQGCYFSIFHSSQIARLISLLLFLLTGYLLTTLNSLFGFSDGINFILGRFSTAIPGIVWLIACYLFSDEDRIHPLAWALLIAYFILRSIGRFLELTEVSISYLAFIAIPQLIMLGFSVHALYLAVRGYYSDLIEIRRVIRVMFVACIAILVTLVLGNGLVEVVRSLLCPTCQIADAPVADTAIPFYILILTASFTLFCFNLRDDLHSLVGKPTSRELLSTFKQKKLIASDLGLVEKITHAMQVEKRYLEAGFTIIKLSKQLGVHEYRVRRVINQELKYRNFNQFLNRYRIEDAAARLSTTNNSVSAIALDVGFASLSAFNTAFKEYYKMTPTRFRLDKFTGDETP